MPRSPYPNSVRAVKSCRFSFNMAGQLLVAQPRGCGTRLSGGTAIPTEPSFGAGEDSEAEEDAASARPARVLAVIALLALVLSLALLPALVGFALAPGPVVRLAAGLGSLVAVVGGVKLAAVIWGLVARFAASPGRREAATAIDLA